MILVSACLAGLNCKYNGKNNYNEKIFNLVKMGKAIPICPEQLGGLTTPRKPSEIKYINGKKRVINIDGVDVTEEYEKGAKEVLELAKKLNVTKVILKDRSPACGKGKIYDGTFTSNLVNGNGILTDLLLENNIDVISLEEYIK